MSDNFAERLIKKINEKGTCATVGIDPVYERLPRELREGKDFNDSTDLEAAIDAIFEFSIRAIRVVAPLVPAVKFNIAFFEKYYWEGIETYYSLVQEALGQGLEVIGDVKRGDIGSTCAAYAAAHLKNPAFIDMDHIDAPDAITINGFAGTDGIEPFARTAQAEGKGVFVWVRASNPSAALLQDFANAEGKTFFELLAEQVATLACQPQYVSDNGYSCLGMVVGGTAARQAAQLRQQYPHILFLVPGYGAQNATAEDCMRFCKPDGTGALVTASRSIIYAFDNPRYAETYGDNWEKCIEQACLDMKADLAQAMQQA